MSGGKIAALPSARLRAMERAIRAKCLDCSGGMKSEVRGCRMTWCPLWEFRCLEATGTSSVPPSAGPLPQGGRLCENGEIAGQMNIRELIGEAMG